MLHCIQSRLLVYYKTSLLDQNILRGNGNLINIHLKNTSNMIWHFALINPLQQELYICTPAVSHSEAVLPSIHQASPSTYGNVNRRWWWWWWEGSCPARCSSGGRSGREGGHSEGSSGDPPRRSAPSYIPEQQKGGTKMRDLHWEITWAWTVG